MWNFFCVWAHKAIYRLKQRAISIYIKVSIHAPYLPYYIYGRCYLYKTIPIQMAMKSKNV